MCSETNTKGMLQVVIDAKARPRKDLRKLLAVDFQIEHNKPLKKTQLKSALDGCDINKTTK